MSDAQQKLHIIRQYLQDEFAGHGVAAGDDPAGDVRFTIEQADRRYELQVDSDFLDEQSAAGIRDRLVQWKVRDELCRAEGMPVILTSRGVRLVSSN